MGKEFLVDYVSLHNFFLYLFVYLYLFFVFFVSDLIHWSLIFVFLKWRFKDFLKANEEKLAAGESINLMGFDHPDKVGETFFSVWCLEWVFPQNGGAPKWMVYNGKPYWNHDLGGKPTIFGKSWHFFVCQEFEVLVIGGRSEQTGQTSKLELGS